MHYRERETESFPKNILTDVAYLDYDDCGNRASGARGDHKVCGNLQKQHVLAGCGKTQQTVILRTQQGTKNPALP
jgi:hypothetical protein